jgi:hypothetical protein
MRLRILSCCALVGSIVAIAHMSGVAQERAATGKPDPRVGLKAGLRDAGEAARGMERVASLSNPSGFFDPKVPAGEATPPERDPNLPPPDPNAPPDPRYANLLAFGNSDLAFSGNHLFMGSFHGFNTYDVENGKNPKLLGSVVCPGGQGDMSVHGNLLFMSVEQTRGRLDCGTGGVQEKVSVERFRGVRIFDITDIKKPRQVAAIQTCRGSHTHTLVTAPNDKDNIYVYGSGTSSVRSGEELAGCSDQKPEEDPNTALFSIDVIKVPLAHPETAAIVNRPRIFADPKTGAISGLWAGGDHGPGTQKTSVTNQCHDITVFPQVGLAAGACSGNGILLDIHDPVHPVRLDDVSDKNFAYWHSATFNNDGTKVIFTDEWGGGLRPHCRATDPLTWGADAIFDIVEEQGHKKLEFGAYYKMPAAQSEQENCVAHNGALIPVPGRDIMSQAWYQGGVSVFDFTDSAHPIEIAFFDRGPIDARQLVTGGYWSTYWFNGFIYGSEIARGVDVFRLTPSEHMSQSEIDAATMARVDEFNAQQQSQMTWPDNSAVARAYVDQLTRSRGIPPERARAVRSALEKVDGLRSGQEKSAAGILEQVDALARQLDADAGAATGRDAARLKALAATLKGRAAKLR